MWNFFKGSIPAGLLPEPRKLLALLNASLFPGPNQINDVVLHLYVVKDLHMLRSRYLALPIELLRRLSAS
jgi:hypothetical protein